MNCHRTTTAMGLALSMGILAAAGCATHDSVDRADRENKARHIDNSPKIEAAEFLVEMADSRMLSQQMGEIAATRGATEPVRSYGRALADEQDKILSDLRSIARQENIVLPDGISKDSSAELTALRGEAGRDFDKMFLETVKEDHREDIEELREATDLENDRVRSFARNYLPMLERQFQEADSIDRSV